jgi:hypothetical protein
MEEEEEKKKQEEEVGTKDEKLKRSLGKKHINIKSERIVESPDCRLSVQDWGAGCVTENQPDA